MGPGEVAQEDYSRSLFGDPHPHALTMELRGEDRHNAYRGVSEKCVPLWHEGVLCLDLDSLRKLETADAQTLEAILRPVA